MTDTIENNNFSVTAANLNRIAELENLVEARETVIAELRAEIADIHREVGLLNSWANDAADAHSWCSEYDQRISQWDSQLSRISLVGRVREYDVTVQVTLTYNVTIPNVEATDADAAAEKIEWKDVRDSLDTSDWDDYDWEVSDTEESS